MAKQLSLALLQTGPGSRLHSPAEPHVQIPGNILSCSLSHNGTAIVLASSTCVRSVAIGTITANHSSTAISIDDAIAAMVCLQPFRAPMCPCRNGRSLIPCHALTCVVQQSQAQAPCCYSQLHETSPLPRDMIVHFRPWTVI
jgi:hypothetical protein